MLLYLQLGISGLITGLLYALLALGLVLVFRTVRVLNLAHGAIATLGVYLFIQLTDDQIVGYWAALGIVLLVGALLGALIDRGVMAHIAGRSLLAKIIATLGILLVLQTVIGLVWGFDVQTVSSGLPAGAVPIGNLSITFEQMIVAGVSVTIGLGLWWTLGYTYFGMAMRAVSQSTDTSTLLGIDVDRISMVTWAIGSALAVLAGVLLAPLIVIEPVRLTAFLPKAFAAALVGRLVSLPGAFAGGVLLGLVENYVPLWVSIPGAPDAIAFLLIVALLAVRAPRLASGELEAKIA